MSNQILNQNFSNLSIWHWFDIWHLSFGIIMRFAFITIFGFALLGFWANTADAGFGISPPWFRNSHLSPGSHYEQDIFLVQGKPDTDVKITATIESAEQIADWISFKPGTEFIIPAGAQQFPVRVIVDVPRDAGYTTYKGKIRFVATSVGADKNSNIAIQLGSLAEISLTVTSEEFTDFKVDGVNVSDIEESSPIGVNVRIENLGNVKVRPTKIMLKIWDTWHDKILQEGEAETTDWVDSFSEGTIHATMPTELPVGDYFADFEVYKGEEVVARDRERFNIVEEGALNHWPRFLGISIAWWGGGFGGLLALVGIIKFNLIGRLLLKLGIEIKRASKNSPRRSGQRRRRAQRNTKDPQIINEPTPVIGFRPVAAVASARIRRTRTIKAPRTPQKPVIKSAKTEPKKRGRPRKQR